jgi:hypothetical protein
MDKAEKKKPKNSKTKAKTKWELLLERVKE